MNLFYDKTRVETSSTQAGAGKTAPVPPLFYFIFIKLRSDSIPVFAAAQSVSIMEMRKRQSLLFPFLFYKKSGVQCGSETALLLQAGAQLTQPGRVRLFNLSPVACGGDGRIDGKAGNGRNAVLFGELFNVAFPENAVTAAAVRALKIGHVFPRCQEPEHSSSQPSAQPFPRSWKPAPGERSPR